DIYEPPRYMSVSQACSQMIDIIREAGKYESIDGDENQTELDIKKLVESKVITEDTLAVGLARVGRGDQALRVDTVTNLSDCDLGEPLHSLVIAGKLHPLEVDFLRLFYNGDNFDNLVNQHNDFYSKK
ncbi:diphthine methyl ester synthase, partial [Brachionus plicatilis]